MPIPIALEGIPPLIVSNNIMIENLRHVRTEDTELYDVSDGSELQEKTIIFDRGEYTIFTSCDFLL